MLLFSIMLDINSNLTKSAFIQLIIRWNQNSPHSSNIIPDIVWHGEHNIRFGNDDVWMEFVEYHDIIAVRYEKKENDNISWRNDYIMNFASRKMAVRLSRNYAGKALFINSKFSIPYFIALLIEQNYLQDDGNLPVSNLPFIIDNSQIPLLADMINRKTSYRLPVVYISKTIMNDNPVDVTLLANRLRGAAHVLVQKSLTQDKKLMKLCNRKNEYHGAVGIYFPDDTAGHRKYLYRASVGTDSFLLEKVVRTVMQYSTLQQLDTLYTWQGVNNALLMERLRIQRDERIAAEQAKKEAENEYLKLLDEKDEDQKKFRKQVMEEARAEADTLLESFDADMAKLQHQVDELTKANEALRYENQGLRAKLSGTEAVPVLYMGDEHEFYEGEIKDLILLLLSEALNNLPDKTRRSDIIKDILRNNGYQQVSKKRADKIKAIFKHYDGMTSKVRQILEEYGFVITEEGKHIKATYYGDGRYYITLAKTPSDERAGKNNAASIIKICF